MAQWLFVLWVAALLGGRLAYKKARCLAWPEHELSSRVSSLRARRWSYAVSVAALALAALQLAGFHPLDRNHFYRFCNCRIQSK